MKTFQKVERKRLSELVANQIEEAIIGSTYPIGSQLPSEQQLAEQFGVSRNVVREAFKVLKERGLIAIVNGSGAYVSQPSSEVTTSAMGRYIRFMGADDVLEDLYEARRTLEGTNARLAAERADAEDLASLTNCLERMRQARHSMEQWSAADLDFHLAVAKATHNPFFSLLLEPLVGQLHDVIAEGYQEIGAVERGLEAHTKLYQAIVDRDPELAYLTILEHLRDSEMRVLRLERVKQPTPILRKGNL